jgi:hypothetical protein
VNAINRALDKAALVITNAVATMWCALAFTELALVSLPDAVRAGTSTLISWIAQTFLQLVLLSIIMVGQRLQAESTADLHAKVDAVHAKVHES